MRVTSVKWQVDNSKFHFSTGKKAKKNKQKLLELTLSELWKTAKELQQLSTCLPKKKTKKKNKRQLQDSRKALWHFLLAHAPSPAPE